jgi:hypothetical protein
MGWLLSTAKLGTKVGLAGGAAYFLYTEKFFGTQQESSEALDRLKATASGAGDYVKTLPQVEIPKDLKDLGASMPDVTGKMTEFKKGFIQKWNGGVLYVFEQLSVAPRTVMGYACQVYRAASQQLQGPPEAASKKDEA